MAKLTFESSRIIFLCFRVLSALVLCLLLDPLLASSQIPWSSLASTKGAAFSKTPHDLTVL